MNAETEPRIDTWNDPNVGERIAQFMEARTRMLGAIALDELSTEE